MNEKLEDLVTELESTCVTTIYLKRVEDWVFDETQPEWAAAVVIIGPGDSMLVVRIGLDDDGAGQVIATGHTADGTPSSPEVTVLGESIMITS